MSWTAEAALTVLMAVAVTGVLVCVVAGVLWNRRVGFAPLQVPAPVRGFGPPRHLEGHPREGNGPRIAELHRRATRVIRRGERAESPGIALLVCHRATQSYYNWQNPCAAWNTVFLAPLFAGYLALTGSLSPETALVTAVALFLAALVLPVYRIHVLRRSAWAIEANRDLVEGAEPPEPPEPP